MISQFFILSARGDVIINRDFRSDLIKTTQEIFYRNVKLYKGKHFIIFYSKLNKYYSIQLN
jgi:AP-4 complex subunit mu-1